FRDAIDAFVLERHHCLGDLRQKLLGLVAGVIHETFEYDVREIRSFLDLKIPADEKLGLAATQVAMSAVLWQHLLRANPVRHKWRGYRARGSHPNNVEIGLRQTGAQMSYLPIAILISRHKRVPHNVHDFAQGDFRAYGHLA